MSVAWLLHGLKPCTITSVFYFFYIGMRVTMGRGSSRNRSGSSVCPRDLNFDSDLAVGHIKSCFGQRLHVMAQSNVGTCGHQCESCRGAAVPRSWNSAQKTWKFWSSRSIWIPSEEYDTLAIKYGLVGDLDIFFGLFRGSWILGGREGSQGPARCNFTLCRRRISGCLRKLCGKPYAIGSMYAIYGNIYHQYNTN